MGGRGLHAGPGGLEPELTMQCCSPLLPKRSPAEDAGRKPWVSVTQPALGDTERWERRWSRPWDKTSFPLLCPRGQFPDYMLILEKEESEWKILERNRERERET